MHTTRPFISQNVKRLLMFVALTATVLCPLPSTRRASACSFSMPLPLRPLYISSERVVVARAGQSAVLRVEKEEDYERALLRTSFYVSKTLKGKEEEGVVHVYQWVAGEKPEVPEDFAEDTTLLLFLRHSEEGEGYNVADNSFGAKKLSDDALKIYLRRIEELAAILSAEKPDKAQIVEWLVRCAEEPATRWEGAYELDSSQDALLMAEQKDSSEQSESEATQEAPAEAAPEITQDDSEAIPDGVTNVEIVALETPSNSLLSYNPEFARLLTAAQKERLANTLFSLQSFEEGDRPLLHLVLGWNDERLVPFILAQLERVKQEPPFYVQQLVTTLAEKFQDEKLIARAEWYNNNAMYYEPDESEEGVSEGNEEMSEETSMDKEEKELKGSSVQKRSARLQKFLAEVNSFMSNQIALGRSKP